MNDLKNFFIASVSAVPTFAVAIATERLISIVSAIVLPVIFFAVGKSIDIAIQIYYRRRMFAALGEKKHDESTEINDRVGGPFVSSDADTLDGFGDQAPEPRTRKGSGRKSRIGGAKTKRRAGEPGSGKRNPGGRSRKTPERDPNRNKEAER